MAIGAARRVEIDLARDDVFGRAAVLRRSADDRSASAAAANRNSGRSRSARDGRPRVPAGTVRATSRAKSRSVSRSASAGFITANQNIEPAAATIRTPAAWICASRRTQTDYPRDAAAPTQYRDPGRAVRATRRAASDEKISRKRRSVGCSRMDNPGGTPKMTAATRRERDRDCGDGDDRSRDRERDRKSTIARTRRWRPMRRFVAAISDRRGRGIAASIAMPVRTASGGKAGRI